MVSDSSTRTKVFISYSHKDAKYLDQLVEHLAYYERNNLIETWSDKKITAGAQWREEIKRAIDLTKVAVLLISSSFLASKFIAEDELPPLLHAAQKEGAIILPVIVRSSNFEDTELANFQAVNSPSIPVAKMKGYQRDELWTNVVRKIRKAVASLQVVEEMSKQSVEKQVTHSEPVDKDVLPDEGKEDVFNLLLNRDEVLFANDSDISTLRTSFAEKAPSEFMINRDLVQNTASVTLEQVKSAWEQVRKRVRGKNATGPKTAAYLNDFSIVGVEGSSDEIIVIIQAAHTLHYKYMKENNYSADVEWALSIEFDWKCRLHLLAPSWKYVPALTLQQVQAGWEQVKKRVRGKNATGPKTAAYLGDYTVVYVESGDSTTIVTIQPAHTLHYKYMKENNYSADVEWALELEFSQPCGLRLLAPGQSIPGKS